jgi:hypothetical protein
MEEHTAHGADGVVGLRGDAPIGRPVSAAVALDFDESSFLSHGRDSEGDTAVILTEIVVWTDQAPAARSIAFGSGRIARMMIARVLQDMTPIRTTAAWDGVCWHVQSIEPFVGDA